MAHIVDVRSAGGEFVILGDALGLPTSSSNTSHPSQGSIRYNPLLRQVELYDPLNSLWSAFGSGSGSVILVSNVYNFVNILSPTSIGTLGFATDGRKPAEYDYGFSGRTPIANSSGTGVAIVFGFSDSATTISNNATWLSTSDYKPVQS